MGHRKGGMCCTARRIASSPNTVRRANAIRAAAALLETLRLSSTDRQATCS